MRAIYTCSTREGAGPGDPTNVEVEADTYETVDQIINKAIELYKIKIVDVVHERRIVDPDGPNRKSSKKELKRQKERFEEKKKELRNEEKPKEEVAKSMEEAAGNAGPKTTG